MHEFAECYDHRCPEPVPDEGVPDLGWGILEHLERDPPGVDAIEPLGGSERRIDCLNRLRCVHD